MPETAQTIAFGMRKLTSGFHKGKGKGKAIPLQAWTSPECSRRL